MYQVQLLRSLFQPQIHSYQVKKAERLEGIWVRTTLLLVIAALLSGLSAYYGIGNETLSNKIHDLTPTEFETLKALFAVGQVLKGITLTTLLIFFPALIFWLSTEIEYRKLVIMQLVVATIFLLEKGVSIPFHLYYGLDKDSLPFSFGVMAQYITDYKIIVHFFSSITLFNIWSMVFQYRFLKASSEKNPRLLLAIIISINLLFWIMTALFSYMRLDKLI